ncbi:MAG: DUF4998 domain-containing protein [Dysgonomonas sp.]|nr:DUF4998 domain-containing protein [Dysgonomonas sp.]
MKRLLFYPMIMVLAWLAISCDDMNDPHEPYLREGEIIYASKVDSVGVRSGNMRLALNIYIKTQRIQKGILYWNNKMDSLEVSLEGIRGNVFKEVVIENLEEKSYVFNLISYDANNNKSLPFEVVGNVYGENYSSSLLNRTIDKIEKVDNKAVITWRRGSEALGVKIKYINDEGEAKEIFVESDADETEIEDFVSGEEFSYVTFYKPEENALDIFEAPERVQTFP